MTRKLTLLALYSFVAWLSGAACAHAGPVEDRGALVDHYRKAFPWIGFENYVYGALAMNTDAKRQYDDIMAFPPFAIDLDEARKTWEQPFRNGKRFSSCFPNGARDVAGNYPYYDAATRRVVTFERAINNCLEANGEPALEYGGTEMGLLTAYAKSLSDGMKVDVKVEGAGALAAYQRGRQYYYAQRGRQKYSCASCHVDNAGKFIRGDQVSMTVGQATHYPVFLGGTEVTTLHKRFQQCNRNIGAEPLKMGNREYDELEYFLTYMSNGLPMQTPVFRK
jgi:sulfur-oxidizing protein SoxA